MYSVLMIDPPWPIGMAGSRKNQNLKPSLDYPTLSMPALQHLLQHTILPLACPNHTVFLWTVDQFLTEAEYMMGLTFGYRRHARLIWDKGTGLAPAFSVRYSHEYLLWYYKGKFQPVAEAARGVYSTVFRATRREHSRKPDGAYRMVEHLYPTARRLDVFAREIRPGWDAWGNETTKFQHLESRHANAQGEIENVAEA